MKLKILYISILISLILTGCVNSKTSNNTEEQNIIESISNTEITSDNITEENIIKTGIEINFETESEQTVFNSNEESVTEIIDNIQTEKTEPQKSETTIIVTEPILIETTQQEIITEQSETQQIEEITNISEENIPQELLFSDYENLYVQRPEYTVSDEKTVYLTFDDGPNPITTPAILDILAENNIKATFFVVGKNISGNEDILQRILDEGHLLGIHTYCHDYDEIYKSVNNYKHDFQQCFNLIYDTTNYKPWAFRFPGGSINNHNKEFGQTIAEEMTLRGFEYFDWTASLEDATINSDYDYCMSQFYNSCTKKYEIVLMHDSKNISLICLPEIIKYCQNNGYNFDTLSNANYHFSYNN